MGWINAPVGPGIAAMLLVCACSSGAPQAADNPSSGAPLAADKGGRVNSGDAATAPAPSPTASQTALTADTRLIVAFGDSLYAGYGVAQSEGFAPDLERALTASGVKVRVHNAGVSGDTTAAGLARLAFTLDGLPRKPDLVIVGLGGNDLLRGLNPDQTRANLDAILTELDRRGIPAMLTGMLASPNMGADYVRAFNPIFPALARVHNAALYPFFLDGVAGRPALIQADGLHPNAAGIDVIVGKVTPVVAAALAQLPR